MKDILSIRQDFPILSRQVHGKPLVYLDNAATAQKPLAVIEKTDELYRFYNANIHRGVHFLSENMTGMYEEARETVRKFINAGTVKELVFTSGATAAINTVSHSFGEKFVGKGDNIIISELEHHSNIVPWQMLAERKGAQIRVLPFDDSGRIIDEMLSGLIDERTRIVAITQASNVLSTEPDLKKIISIAHDAGVPVLIDGCQGIVHGKVDVTELDCDFYVFSGHKLYGPTGIGILYGKEELLEQMPPFLAGGDMVNTVSFSGTTFAELPLKFEAGTSNFIGAIAMAEGIVYLESLGMNDIQAYENQLSRYACELFSDIGGIRIYGNPGAGCPILSFTVDGTHPYDIGMIVDKMGIAIRTGTHCAQPVMEHYGISGMCRASFAFYNTTDEAENLARAIKKAVSILT